MAQVAVTTKLYSQTCCNCGIEFAVPEDFDARRRQDRKLFYCPSGHGQSYNGKTEAEKLREQLAAAEERIITERRSREWAEKQTRAANVKTGKAKAAMRRLTHRVECGVCPHCQRTFKQLAAHMKSKHGV